MIRSFVIALFLKALHRLLWRKKSIKGYVIQGVFIPFYFVSSNAVAITAKVLNNVTSIKSFCEVGSGSGYIAIELLKEFENLYAVIIDIDENAAKISKINAKKIGVFSRLDIVQCLSGHCLRKKSFDLALSNPPYLPCPASLSVQLCSGIDENVYIDIVSQLVRVSKRFVMVSSSSLAKAWRAVSNIFKGVVTFAVKTPFDEVKVMLIDVDMKNMQDV
ncbi:MAG: methyltransferase domain-containing protein [Ignisphaera sp.]